MSNPKRIITRGVFVVAVILGVTLAVYLLYGKKDQNIKIATLPNQNIAGVNTTAPINTNTNTPKTTASTPAAISENFFQKPGAQTANDVASTVVQDKTVTELEESVQKSGSTVADYNSLAIAYYKNGDKDKALQVIGDGLNKYPNDNSLLLTKDLIENILPKL